MVIGDARYTCDILALYFALQWRWSERHGGLPRRLRSLFSFEGPRREIVTSTARSEKTMAEEDARRGRMSANGSRTTVCRPGTSSPLPSIAAVLGTNQEFGERP